ncbi:MAG: FkbM family methyltransferase [Silvanigrellaceae bacterium]|nr:FkbM family methyltransferase [Silvanigrellaceae bacterium]
MYFTLCVLFFFLAADAAVPCPLLPENQYQAEGYDNCDMLLNGEYSVINNFIKPGMCIFDIGANKGEWTRAALSVTSELKMYAFEPVTELCEALRKESFGGSIELIQCALSDCEQLCNFFYYPGEKLSGLSGMFHRPILQDQLKVSPKVFEILTISLDNFCSDKNIDKINFVKIDTEGAELKIIKGAIGMLKKGAIDAIQFEYGGTYLDSCATLEELYKLLQAHGFSVYRISSRGLLHIPYWISRLENYRYSNYLALRNEAF